MQVAYIINQYPKVSHTFIRREILALEKAGAQVHRVAMRGWDDILVDEVDMAERDKTFYLLQGGLLPCLSALTGMLITSPFRFFRSIKNVLRLSKHSEISLLRHLVYLAEGCYAAHYFRNKNIAHIHAHFGTNSTEVALQSSELSAIPFSFTVHGPEEFDRPGALGIAYKIKKSAFVVAISSFGRSQMYRYTQVAHWDKIKVVRCGVDEEFFKEADPTINMSNNLVCVGRLCEQKGQFLLIKALALLNREHIDFTLVLAGDGEMRPILEKEIAALGLMHKIQITGWLSSSEVRQHMLDARALILPSFAEGLPVVIMEAMTLHRLVVSTYVAGIPELVENAASGFLVPPGDVSALADVLKKTLNANAATLQTIAERAYTRVRIFHNIDTEALVLLNLFKEQAQLKNDSNERKAQSLETVVRAR